MIFTDTMAPLLFAASKVFSLALILALMLIALPIQSVQALGGGSGSISLTAVGTAYAQNFDTLANTGTTNNITVINGWYLDEGNVTATANNGLYAAGTGSGNTGDTYSFGASGSAERAFGGLLSGSVTPTIGASFTNNTGQTVTTLVFPISARCGARVSPTAACRIVLISNSVRTPPA